MAFNKKQAVDAVQEILRGARAAEAPRLEGIARALRPAAQIVKGSDGYSFVLDATGRPASFPVEIPKNAPGAMMRLALKAEVNYLPLILDTFSQAMKVDGYYTTDAAGKLTAAGPAWKYWQRNRMDARQTGIHRTALKYGIAYASVLPGDQGPVIRGYSPRKMTALYQEPEIDEWPIMALEVDGSMIRLFDEGQVYYLGAENKPRASYSLSGENDSLISANIQFLEARAHDAGVCPIVRYRDRMLLDGEEQLGIVEPLMTVQASVNETKYGRLVAQFFAAFKQRYVIGWVPESESEEMKAGAAEVWYFKDDTVKVDQFAETDLTRYIDAKNADVRDLAALAQAAPQSFGIDAIANISQETVAALEEGQHRKTDEITTSLGESHEQTLRLCSHLGGDEAGAADYASQVRWADRSARSFAQTVDGLGKLVTMLGIPQEIAWEKIPDWTDTDVQRAIAMKMANPSDTALLADALSRQSTPAEA